MNTSFSGQRNFKLRPLSLAVLAACSLTAFSAAAQTTTVLEEVVVSGSRAATKLSETPQAIGKVKNTEIKREKPVTVGEVINRIPGVQWNDLGNEQHSMGIRQPINTNAVYQYLEDGIPIRPLGVFNHNALNETNMEGTDSVEVVKGAASSLYGSNAVGGAVNFLTAAPSRTLTGKIGARYDSKAGYKRVDTMLSNTWDKLGIRFSHYSSRRDTNNWQEYSRGEKDSFTLRADYALSDASQIRFTAVHTYLDTAMTGSVFENDYQNNPGKSINTFTYRKDKTTRVNLAWEGETTDKGLTTVTAFYRKNDHGQLPSYTISNCSGSTCRGTINNNAIHSLGLDIKHQQDFNWLSSRLVAGIYYDKSDNPYFSNNLNITRDPVTGRYLSYTLANNTRPAGVRDYKTDIKNIAAFAQWESSPLQNMRMVLGARSDSIEYDFTNNLAPAGSANYGAPNGSKKFSRLSPKAGLTYALSKEANVYGNYSLGFTPPEVSQLYGARGVPNLKPTVYKNHELGYRHNFLGGALKLNSAIYRLDGTDTIVSYTLSPGVSENRNAGSTRSEGLELGLNYESKAFDARLAANWAKHRYLQYKVSSALDYSGKTMPAAPRSVISAEVGYKPLEGARVALEMVRRGSYWMNNANTVKYPGHTLLNLRGSYQFAKGWEAWAQVRNLTNKKYANSASSSYSGIGTYTANTQNQYTPGAPRSFLVGLVYTFGE